MRQDIPLKVGDIVTCEDNSGPYIYLYQDKEYTVERVEGAYIKLAGCADSLEGIKASLPGTCTK